MINKPPLGLRSRLVVESLRIQEILEAMQRYNNALVPIPKEWIQELEELNERQRLSKLYSLTQPTQPASQQ